MASVMVNRLASCQGSRNDASNFEQQQVIKVPPFQGVLIIEGFHCNCNRKGNGWRLGGNKQQYCSYSIDTLWLQ